MKDIFIIFNGLSVPRSWLRSGSGSMTYDTRMTYENVKIHKKAEPFSDECWVR